MKIIRFRKKFSGIYVCISKYSLKVKSQQSGKYTIDHQSIYKCHSKTNA